MKHQDLLRRLEIVRSSIDKIKTAIDTKTGEINLLKKRLKEDLDIDDFDKAAIFANDLEQNIQLLDEQREELIQQAELILKDYPG